MAKARKRQQASGDPAAFDLLVEVPATFFLLRALGRQIGAVTNWGGGLWGFLRTLKLEGPLTVPQIARSRPVARQLIQKLADDAAAEGLVEFVDNPHHRRSKLVRLTAKGEARYLTITDRLTALTAELSDGLDPAALRTAADTLSTLRQRLRARMP